MLHVAAGRPVAVLLAAAALILCHGQVSAQALGAQAAGADDLDAPLDPAQPLPELPPLEGGPELDPSAPLDPMPDIGIDWPDMDDADGVIADAPAQTGTTETGEREYTIAIAGLDAIDGTALRAQFDGLSVLEANRQDPANAAQIDRRAREDADLLAELLRAYGYYDADVSTRVEAREGSSDLAVTLEAEPGPQYTFAEVSFPGIESAEDQAALRDAFGIAPGDPIDAARVRTGRDLLRTALGERGYAFAELGDLDIAVDHETRTATLVQPVTPAGARAFGEIRVEGDPLFSARHIARIARFEPGEPYEASRIEDLRRALVATGLVSQVTIRPIDDPATRRVDIAVALEPAPLRTIAGSAGYGTGEGVRAEVSWQHRNLIRPEGAVTLRGVVGTREQLVSASLRRNNFLRRDQVLTGQVAASHVERDAYEADTFILAGGIERQSNIIWQKKWTWSLGAELIATDERDVDVDTGTTRSRTFLIGAFPASLAYDGSNDLLDPTSGFRLSGRFSPEASLQDGVFGYSRFQIDGSFYRPISDRVTIAGRARLGTIVGAGRDRIAPSRRFYAGGGGSVRGYGFQRLGPRDPIFDDPIGGRSLTEFALEARIRVKAFNDSLGIVPFIDAGNIYTSPLPGVDDLRLGAGIGARYHTSFGPIRVDVGTPLNPRDGDARVAVYVSLGQAF